MRVSTTTFRNDALIVIAVLLGFSAVANAADLKPPEVFAVQQNGEALDGEASATTAEKGPDFVEHVMASSLSTDLPATHDVKEPIHTAIELAHTVMESTPVIITDLVNTDIGPTPTAIELALAAAEPPHTATESAPTATESAPTATEETFTATESAHTATEPTPAAHSPEVVPGGNNTPSSGDLLASTVTVSTPDTQSGEKFSGQSSKLSVGRTPLVELHRLKSTYKLLAKCEFKNPYGSANDRIAFGVIQSAIKDGRLKFDGEKKPFLAVTSADSVGVSFAMVGAALGIKVHVVAPRNLDDKYIQRIKAVGGKVIHPAVGKSHVKLAAYLSKKYPEWTVIDYKTEPASIESQVNGLLGELLEDLQAHNSVPKMFVFYAVFNEAVSAVSTKIKTLYPEAKVVAVKAPAKEGQEEIDYAAHDENTNEALALLSVDDLVQPSNEQAILMANKFARKTGVLVGPTSGAVLHAALQAAKNEQYDASDAIVVILPDSF